MCGMIGLRYFAPCFASNLQAQLSTTHKLFCRNSQLQILNYIQSVQTITSAIVLAWLRDSCATAAAAAHDDAPGLPRSLGPAANEEHAACDQL